MELTHIRYFCKIAECKNVTHAANELHVSQPWLSRMLKSLESELGVSLFSRNHRQMLLTAEGEVFYRSAKSALDTLDSATNIIRSSSQNSLAVPVSIHPPLSAAIKKFQELHPEISIFYALSAKERAEVDFLTTSENTDPRKYEAIPIFLEEMFLLAPSDEASDPVELIHFKDRQFIFPGDGSPASDLCLNICKSAGFTPNIIMHSDDFVINQRIIATRRCVMLIPESRIGNLSPEVIQLHLSPPEFRQIFLAYPKRDLQSRASKLFLDFVCEYFSTTNRI